MQYRRYALVYLCINHVVVLCEYQARGGVDMS